MGQQSSIGLACAGGVIEGALYEIGVLCALEEAIEGLQPDKLDVYVGVSSGGLVASCLANGIPPRTLSRAVVSKAGDESLNVSPEVFFSLATQEYANRLASAPQTALDALRHYAANPGDLSVMGALADLTPLLPVGIFDNTPLERYLARAFASGARTNDFRRLSSKLRILAMDLDTAEGVVFGEEITDVPISKAIQASTALPVFYCPVEINGRLYVDGVALRTVNASIALNEGADLLFCINPIVPINLLLQRRLNKYLPRHLAEHGLPAVLSQTFRALVHSRMQTGFRDYELRFPDRDIVLIEPDFEEQNMFFSNIFSFSNRHAVCEQSYQMTRRYLLNQRESLQPTLERHGLRLRVSVLDDPERTLFGTRQPWTERPSTQLFEDAGQVLDRLDRVLDRMREAA